YLPQFHPDPLNDQAWGPGFTEWHNVARARPRRREHRQPRLPGELGFYDLRLPETRERQAELAHRAGIDGFAYYHYWFGDGKRALQRPFDEVLQSGRPDLPFCLVWANHDWTTRTWSAAGRRPTRANIVSQTYSTEDVDRHIEMLLPALQDERAIHLEGHPVFAVFDAAALPRSLRFPERLREAAAKAGLSGVHLVSMSDDDPEPLGFDAGVRSSKLLFKSGRSERLRSPGYLARRLTGRCLTVDYADITGEILNMPASSWRSHETIVTGWDDTPRRGPRRAVVVTGYSAAALGDQARAAVRRLTEKDQDQLLFVKSWNEWGEGNYLEPDADDGTAAIEALGSVLGQRDS
ncbi:MAG: hypothetical protein ACI83Y_002402, partial [Candidatus Azotimanducaceae bacterium]